jgi:hypothetical protein
LCLAGTVLARASASRRNCFSFNIVSSIIDPWVQITESRAEGSLLPLRRPPLASTCKES